ncbi:hypothetical protein [Burkholderia pseudomallei]|uniref:hypothetical protein n=1 Tax=Burkholderia pseudomallei TaxID=28450 RepID=UPI003F6562ED
MSLHRKGINMLRRAMVGALDILEDTIRSYLFRSGGLPTAIYCTALAVVLYAALHAL